MLLLLSLFTFIISFVLFLASENAKFLLINLLIIVYAFFWVTGINVQIWEWQHTGIITAVDTSGVFIKSTTVYFKTDAQSSQEDKYCLKDTSIIKELQSAQESKKLVTLEYKKYISNWFVCDYRAWDVITSIK